MFAKSFKSSRLWSTLFFSACIFFILACASASKDDNTLIYWTAPNINVAVFDRQIVQEWRQTFPEKPIRWEPIPAGTTSEEVILTAIATGTAPDISTNIFAGFAAQLADAAAVAALDTFPGFWELVEKRRMTRIVRRHWMYKGHVYVLPIYISPQLMWYNKAVLDSLGVTTLPRTYSAFLDLARRARNELGVYALWLDLPPVWWKRWFDFVPFFFAASNGVSYLDLAANRAALDSEAGLQVTRFFATLFTEALVPRFDIKDGFEKGRFLAAIRDAGALVRMKKLFPDVRYVIGDIPVPDGTAVGEHAFTLAEQKGLVIFNQSTNKQRAWEFIRWFFSDAHDRLWLETTHYLPARDDLLTNPKWASFFQTNPALKRYAESIPFSASLAPSPKTVQIFSIINRELWQPLIYQMKSPAKAVMDANTSISKLLHSGV